MSVATAAMYGKNPQKAEVIGASKPCARASPSSTKTVPELRSEAPWLQKPFAVAAPAHTNWLMTDAEPSTAVEAHSITSKAPCSALHGLLEIEADTPNIAAEEPAVPRRPMQPHDNAQAIASHLLASSSASGASTPMRADTGMHDIAADLDSLQQSLQQHMQSLEVNGNVDNNQQFEHYGSAHAAILALQQDVLNLSDQVQSLEMKQQRLQNGATNNIKALHVGALDHKKNIETLHSKISDIKTQLSLQDEGLRNHRDHIIKHKSGLETHSNSLRTQAYQLKQQDECLRNHTKHIREHQNTLHKHYQAMRAHTAAIDAHEDSLQSKAEASAHTTSTNSHQQLQDMQKMLTDIRSMYAHIRARDAESGNSVSADTLRSAMRERRAAA